MAGKVLCEATKLYNIINQYTHLPRLAESNYLCLIDARAAESYNLSHIITARNAKWDSDEKFIMPLDVEVESMRYIIVYDSNTHSLSDSGPAIDCADILEKASQFPIQILSGGYEKFSALYPFLRTHKILYNIRETHRLYKQKLEEVSKLQDSCSSSIARQRKKLKDLNESLQECRAVANPEDVNKVDEIHDSIKERSNVFSEMEAFLPKKNELYLSLVLGNVNVTLLNKQSKVLDALFNFLLVWYYCTLTIRESILINNGSKIKGWWVFQHYVSTFLSGVMLTWPDGELYQMFRNQFLSYSMYIKGFQSWMWRGLTFLLPFLFLGHFFQLYNGITLFQMAQLPEWKEWQVLMCGSTFLVLFMGNFFTTLGVVYHKYMDQDKAKAL
ncbi:transmembrane protein 120A [Labeo rohita]|uniref:Transmembrane protein 120A n=1 Tax=Labeo rohita TaxID=84645 RepID=A0A498MGW0_LABRO|nr:transmembrane protein 120A [Labeo rohita]